MDVGDELGGKDASLLRREKLVAMSEKCKAILLDQSCSDYPINLALEAGAALAAVLEDTKRRYEETIGTSNPSEASCQSKDIPLDVISKFLSRFRNVERNLCDALDASRAIVRSGTSSQSDHDFSADFVGEDRVQDVLSLSQRISFNTFGPPEFIHERLKERYELPYPGEQKWNTSMLKAYAVDGMLREREFLARTSGFPRESRTTEKNNMNDAFNDCNRREGGSYSKVTSALAVQDSNVNLKDQNIMMDSKDRTDFENVETRSFVEAKSERTPERTKDMEVHTEENGTGATKRKEEVAAKYETEIDQRIEADVNQHFLPEMNLLLDLNPELDDLANCEIEFGAADPDLHESSDDSSDGSF